MIIPMKVTQISEDISYIIFGIRTMLEYNYLLIRLQRT